MNASRGEGDLSHIEPAAAAEAVAPAFSFHHLSGSLQAFETETWIAQVDKDPRRTALACSLETWDAVEGHLTKQKALLAMCSVRSAARPTEVVLFFWGLPLVPQPRFA